MATVILLRTQRECCANKFLLLTLLSYHKEEMIPQVSQGQSLYGPLGERSDDIGYISTYHNRKKCRNVSLCGGHTKKYYKRKILL